MTSIHPVLLCGGSGTRLWPLSRKGFPKQFVALTGTETLFQAAARRLSGPGFAPPVVVTNADFRFIVAEQLLQAGIEPAAILIEPEGRNTAPAILAATLHIAQSDPRAMVLAAPTDHVLAEPDRFRTAVACAKEAAAQGQIVTFGIRPDRPETGYGWLELAAPAHPGCTAAQPLAGFVEKPDAARAAEMLAGGRHLWNAGIFLFPVPELLAGFEAHAPDLIAPVRAALAGARPDLGFLRLAPAPWKQARDISIDYAIMERAGNLSVVPFDGAWSDLGDWNALWRQSGTDAAGNATSGDVTALDCTGSLIRSETEGLTVVGIGLRDTVVVAMGDAVLVAERSRAQEVREAVGLLKARGLPQAETFRRDHRPWGWFETLADGHRFQVKRIVVHPGAALSLQSHHHRAEHWIVVRGTARVTLDGRQQLVSENESVYVPLGTKHRLENPGKMPMVLIEVQTGSYLGEDDIVRYDDVYARGDGPRG
ncbi:MAG: mannose-1-phosphate guanylyltransferase/mannose-6-phosphate isomerase [Gemmobacter sp.]